MVIVVVLHGDSNIESIVEKYPFKKTDCYTCSGGCSMYSGSWILAYQGSDITSITSECCVSSYQANFAKIPMNTTLAISEGSHVYETVTSTNPNQYPDNGMASDGYWYVKQ